MVSFVLDDTQSRDYCNQYAIQGPRSVTSEDQSKTTNQQGQTTVEKGKINFFVASFSLKRLHMR